MIWREKREDGNNVSRLMRVVLKITETDRLRSSHARSNNRSGVPLGILFTTAPILALSLSQIWMPTGFSPLSVKVNGIFPRVLIQF